MYNLKLIFVLLLIAVCFTNCEKKCKNAYNFDFPFTITPSNDTINIGDTITVESIYDSQLLDKNSNTYIAVNDYDFHFDFIIIKLDSLEMYSFDYFEIIINKGNLTTITFSEDFAKKRIKYSYENNKNCFNVFLIPSKKGIYYIRQIPYISGVKYDDLNITDTECEERVDDFTVVTNEGQDNNYYLLSHSTDSAYKVLPSYAFNKGGGFCFVVK